MSHLVDELKQASSNFVGMFSTNKGYDNVPSQEEKLDVPSHTIMLDDYDKRLYDDECDLEVQTLSERIDEATTLSYKERLIGFGVCFLIGWVVSMASIAGISSIVSNPSKFALFYTLGNLVSLCSTIFLYGPLEQVRTMFHPARKIATCVYLGCIIGTLYAALYLQSSLLVFILMFCQFCAMIWYCSSFIPWGRKILLRMLSAIFSCSCGRIVSVVRDNEYTVPPNTVSTKQQQQQQQQHVDYDYDDDISKEYD